MSLLTPVTEHNTNTLFARLCFAFSSKTPSNVVELWGSLTRTQKISLVTHREPTGISLLHLLCYYTPTNSEMHTDYYTTYFPIFVWVCSKLKQLNDPTRIFNAYVLVKDIDENDKDFYYLESCSPLILSCKRNHMIYTFYLINHGVEAYQYDNRNDGLRSKSTNLIIKDHDMFNISYFNEMMTERCFKKYYDTVMCVPVERQIEDMHSRFDIRRDNLTKLINHAEELVKQGNGDTPMKFNCEPYSGYDEFTLKMYTYLVTPKQFIISASKALSTYQFEKATYDRFFR
jgi:hypothetical protein